MLRRGPHPQRCLIRYRQVFQNAEKMGYPKELWTRDAQPVIAELPHPLADLLVQDLTGRFFISVVRPPTACERCSRVTANSLKSLALSRQVASVSSSSGFLTAITMSTTPQSAITRAAVNNTLPLLSVGKPLCLLSNLSTPQNTVAFTCLQDSFIHLQHVRFP